MYRNKHLAFWVTHPSFDCIIQNPRVTHMEGVFVHPTHPVCMVACTVEAQCYACCTYNHNYEHFGKKGLIWNKHLTACTTQILHTTHSHSTHNALHSPSAYIACRHHPYIESLPTLWYICLPYVRDSVNASWHSFNPKHAHANPCGRNIEKKRGRRIKTVLVSTRVLFLSYNPEFYLQRFRLQVATMPTATLEEFSNLHRSKKIGDGAETKETELNMLQRQRNKCKEVKDWESGGRGIVPGALLKLLVKDKLPHSREVPMNVKEWQLKPPRRKIKDYSAWTPTSTKGWQLKPLKRENTQFCVNYSGTCRLFCYNMKVWCNLF